MGLVPLRIRIAAAKTTGTKNAAKRHHGTLALWRSRIRARAQWKLLLISALGMYPPGTGVLIS